jgi:TusE/DsrC/DsvC family sulfur relay protein
MTAAPTPADLPERDEEGYLVDPDTWNESVAEAIARELDIDLSEEHWGLLRFVRGYYEEHRVMADARYAIRHLDRYHPGQGRQRLFDLFPYGYVGQACKLAGMRRPRAWSTG